MSATAACGPDTRFVALLTDPQSEDPDDWRSPAFHRVVSTDGWYCDVCGVAVNGQTDDQGWPVMEGDNVHHLRPSTPPVPAT